MKGEKLLMIQQKTIGKFKFLIHIFLSFIVWNLIMVFLFKILSGMIYNLLPNNLILYIIIYNLFWMFSSFAQIMLTYYFNRKYIVLKPQLKTVRTINLFVFYIFILFINVQQILIFIKLNMLVSIVFLLLHIILIWIANKKMFNHFFKGDEII